jgi:hypothetical protein
MTVDQHTTETDSLRELFREVVFARNEIVRVRRVHVSSRVELGAARHCLVQALEAYTGGLAASGRPVPYGLRDELRLQRALDDTM